MSFEKLDIYSKVMLLQDLQRHLTRQDYDALQFRELEVLRGKVDFELKKLLREEGKP